MSEGVRITREAATALLTGIFEARDLPPDEAKLVADGLVWADLMGIESHGLVRVPQYMLRLDRGVVNPRPEMKIIKETPAAVVIDGDHSHGQIALNLAIEKALEKAKQVSIGWVIVGDTTHTGAVGMYTRRVASDGMAALYMGASQPNMAYYGAKAGGVSTSPIAMAVPRANGKVLSLDLSTAIAGIGKLLQHKVSNEPLGEGWALDEEGNPTTDPQKAILPTPLGGPKGSGLSLLFECMTSLIAGSAILEPWIKGENQRHHQSALIAAIDIAQFVDLDEYRDQVEALANVVKTLPKADDVDEILMPGERSDAIFEERVRNGYIVPGKVWEKVVEVAEKYSVPLPAVN
mgnify:CR=1 FL=1